MKNEHDHEYHWCYLCERTMVNCGKCGNNTCNGGHGTLKDGTPCDACPSAYAMDQAQKDFDGVLPT